MASTRQPRTPDSVSSASETYECVLWFIGTSVLGLQGPLEYVLVAPSCHFVLFGSFPLAHFHGRLQLGFRIRNDSHGLEHA